LGLGRKFGHFRVTRKIVYGGGGYEFFLTACKIASSKNIRGYTRHFYYINLQVDYAALDTRRKIAPYGLAQLGLLGQAGGYAGCN
jgi:hypothetical protein